MQPYELLERELAEWGGVPNVIACSSGTAALHLALEALRLPLGSEVIVPDFTMIACARAVTLAGLVPVFVDCGPDLLMAPHMIQNAISRKTRAIMLVHVYGRQLTLDPKQYYQPHQPIDIIEDLAEAHGVRPHPDTVAACWSFYKNKIVAGEEGGAVAFKDPVHAAYTRQLRSLGFTDGHDFLHVPRGHNYRMSNCHAKLIRESLHYEQLFVRLRRQTEGWYEKRCPTRWKMPQRDVPWCFDIRVPGLSDQRQDFIIRELRRAGVEARHGFKPMSVQPEYKECKVIGTGEALKASREILYLPLTPGITEEDVDRSMSLLKELVR